MDSNQNLIDYIVVAIIVASKNVNYLDQALVKENTKTLVVETF